MALRSFCRIAVVPSAFALCGCGDGRLETAPVRGTVTCGGVPLTSGSISFNPIVTDGLANAARPAVGVVGPDGSFVLTTYESGDGALIGKHTVRYGPPLPPGEGVELGDGGAPATAAPATPPKPGQKVPCRSGGMAEAEVVAGENDLKIELSPTGPGGEAASDSGRGE